ncbi:hypothetical protein K3495_g5648 [Podosphaera aphanis]|nr:hypothetical protein K3495_g5648 [Podosphaera aphanis]
MQADQIQNFGAAVNADRSRKLAIRKSVHKGGGVNVGQWKAKIDERNRRDADEEIRKLQKNIQISQNKAKKALERISIDNRKAKKEYIKNLGGIPPNPLIISGFKEPDKDENCRIPEEVSSLLPPPDLQQTLDRLIENRNTRWNSEDISEEVNIAVGKMYPDPISTSIDSECEGGGINQHHLSNDGASKADSILSGSSLDYEAEFIGLLLRDLTRLVLSSTSLRCCVHYYNTDKPSKKPGEGLRGSAPVWQQSQTFSQFLNPPPPISPSLDLHKESHTADEKMTVSEQKKENVQTVTDMFASTKITPKPSASINPEITQQDEETRLLNAHLGLLKTSSSNAGKIEILSAPVFTAPVFKHYKAELGQYGFFAGVSDILDKNSTYSTKEDPRVFFNISAPSSAFICGSQGSGKSHTLSCLLENCLMKSDASVLENPLAAIVFHYDTFTSDARGTPCEAAYLASNPKIKVKILCSPTNIETIKRTYSGLNVTIEPLRINQTDLNTKRMLDLMAVNTEEGPMPLYLHSINRILRELRVEQQKTNSKFNYAAFRSKVKAYAMTPAQLMPLTQRLDTLESFMTKSQVGAHFLTPSQINSYRQGPEDTTNDWSIHAGTLTIVDLSCPCVTSEGACALFNMCLGLFLEQKTDIGRIVALDEAHKYMNTSTEATNLTETLLSSIRLQRHLGTRIFISTQEPTISPALLDLCSITIVHRFTSPEWLRCLRQHIAALDSDKSESGYGILELSSQNYSSREVFAEIVKLGVGEALLFAPSAVVGLEQELGKDEIFSLCSSGATYTTKKLGLEFLKLKIRDRLTEDGGRKSLQTPWSKKRSWKRKFHTNPQGQENVYFKMLEAAGTTLSAVIVLGIGFGAGGYGYHKFYKWLVLQKIDGAFQPGDPVLELAATMNQKPGNLKSEPRSDPEDHWVLRDEQSDIDAIINGTNFGHYHLLIGEKGTGKTSMLVEAMRKVQGKGCSMFEAHADLEIFRVRLGKALDYEFHEDYIGGYFSEQGPRDSTALLDIERALNKLEKVALKWKKRGQKPLVLIINSVHLLRDNEDGQNLLELLQQRAEQWAGSNLVTIIFNSNDYWIYERLKPLATRMEVKAISDLPKSAAISALAKYRHRYFEQTVPTSTLEEVFNRIGGRLIFLDRVARAKDMLQACDKIIDIERRWFLNQAWILGSEMDDDVMDQQKYASAAMVLALALVKAEESAEFNADLGQLPEIPLHLARQIMTRSDFIKGYDSDNLFTITSTSNVRADSVPMQQAFRTICKEPGFEQHLDQTLQRIADIESLGRTREIVAKDLILGSKYEIVPKEETRGSRAGWEITMKSNDNDES